MKLYLYKKIGLKHKKDGRINPHKFWMFFMITLTFVLTLEIIALTIFFVISSKKIETPAIPKLDTNSNQIRKIEDTVNKIEQAIDQRMRKN